MSYTDPDEPIPPTVVDRALAVADREKWFVLDLLLLVTIAIALATAYGIWPFIGLAALMIHTITHYGREKR